ncbi:MAG: MipA/OmpV family protein, partial [Bacteriovoracaceae bacterium]
MTRYYYTFTLGLLFLSYSVLAGPFIFLDKSGAPSVITQKEIQNYNQTHSNSILPLWELGGGIVRTQFPDYPGSDFNYNITLPFPAAIYRGDILRAERDEGIRGRFWNHKSFELDLSFDGTLPSRSGKPNPKRAGMPQLET